MIFSASSGSHMLRRQNATRIVFFIVGISMAAWAPLIPFAQARTSVSEIGLGLLLLCFGAGSVITMALAGALTAYFGCRKVVLATAVPIGVSLLFLATASSPQLLAVALLVFGACLGANDVVMNIQAVMVERESGRSMMSGFHALFSAGGLAGAAGMAALLKAGVSPFIATLCVAALVIALLTAAAPGLLPYGAWREAPVFAMPHGIVVFIGVLCFIAFLAEGAVLDWSAVFLTSVRAMSEASAGIGYAVFSLAMTLGRLTGDRFVQRLGGTLVIMLGGTCAALGFAFVSLVPSWQVALVGYSLIGLGCANVVPVLYTRAGQQTHVPEHVAVAAITLLGYAGILLGPALIGFVANAFGLSVAFLMLAALQLGVAGGGRLLRARPIAGAPRFLPRSG